MVIGFKGENSKLKSLYKELKLKELEVEKIEDLVSAINSIDGQTVIVNFNDLMVHDNATADIVEKKVKVMKAVKNCNKNLFLGLEKIDSAHDKIAIDISICTKVATDDMKLIQDLYDFLNTDLAFNGKLENGEYAVKLSNDYRATAKNVEDIKKLWK